MSTDIEALIREAEAAIEQVKSGTFEAWCRAQGLDPDKVKATLAEANSPDAERQAREMFADDMADVNREVESKVAELGVPGPPVTPQASAIRQRRRMGMV